MNTIMMYSIRIIFFFKQKTAYERRISDWSSDVCSSDLGRASPSGPRGVASPGIGGLRLRQLLKLGDMLFDHGHDLARRGLQAGRVAARRIGAVQRAIGRASCRERVGQYV